METQMTLRTRAGCAFLCYLFLHVTYLVMLVLLLNQPRGGPFVFPLVLVSAIVLLGVWLGINLIRARYVLGAILYMAFLLLSWLAAGLVHLILRPVVPAWVYVVQGILFLSLIPCIAFAVAVFRERGDLSARNK
jgi:hypothetical protein